MLVRTDAAGATKEFAAHLHQQRGGVLRRAPASATSTSTPRSPRSRSGRGPRPTRPANPAPPRHGVQIEPRDGAWVAEATGLVDLSGLAARNPADPAQGTPAPRRAAAHHRRRRLRVTGFLTNTTPGGPGRQLADLELRHRRHARVEDRIRAAKDTGLRNLPFHDTDQNRIWLAITALAPTCWPGPPASPCPPPPRSTSPNGCGCGSSPSPDGSCAPPAAAPSRSTPPGPGPRPSPPPTPDSARCPSPDYCPDPRPGPGAPADTLSRRPRLLTRSDTRARSQPATKITSHDHERSRLGTTVNTCRLAVPRHGDRLPHQGMHRVRDGRAHARRTGHRCVADGRP